MMSPQTASPGHVTAPSMTADRFAADYVVPASLEQQEFLARMRGTDVDIDALQYRTIHSNNLDDVIERACRLNAHQGECYGIRREVRDDDGRWRLAESYDLQGRTIDNGSGL